MFLCNVLVLLCYGLWLRRLSQARVLPVKVVAAIAEGFVAALRTAVIANQHPAIRVHRNNCFATANHASRRTVFILDLASCVHLRRWYQMKTKGGRRQSCKERKEEHPAWKFRRETSKAKSPILPCSKTERKSAHPTTTFSANSSQIEYAHLSLYTGQGAGHDVGVVRALPGRQLGISDRLQSGVVPIWVSTKVLRHRKPAY